MCEVLARIARLIWLHVAILVKAKGMQFHEMRFTSKACGPIALNLGVSTLPRVALGSSIDKAKDFRHYVSPRGHNLKQGVISNCNKSILNWIVELEALAVFTIMACSDL